MSRTQNNQIIRNEGNVIWTKKTKKFKSNRMAITEVPLKWIFHSRCMRIDVSIVGSSNVPELTNIEFNYVLPHKL